MIGFIIAISLVFLPSFFIPSLLNDARPYRFLMLLSVILFTHPVINYQKMGSDLPSSDKKSAFLINLSVYISFFIVYGRYLFLTHHNRIHQGHLLYENIFFCICLFLVILRAWSIEILGKWFTSEVVIQEHHTLITSGPYKYIRHPSYTGAALFWILLPLLFQQPELLLITFILIIPGYIYRIKVEESALTGEFGADYEHYTKSTKKLIPFIY